MSKSGIDQDALIQMFADASAKQGEQLRKAVFDATLGALQGRELTLQNIRQVLKAVTKATSTGAAQNALPSIDVEALLGDAVAGMDDALLKAVEANRVALQQFLSQGADMRETHLKKAMSDLEKFEDMLFSTVGKAAESVGGPVSAQWAPVLEKMKLSGSTAGNQATAAVEQVRAAMRDTRASGLKAAQALAESYSALVSGVLIGMSDALQQGGAGATAAKPRAKK